MATVLKSVCGFVGVAICIVLAQKVLGRRPMMLIGHSTAALFMMGIALAGTIAPNAIPAGKAVVACAMLYYAVYNGFSGALSWPIASELVSSRLRVLTIGTGTGVNYIFACRSFILLFAVYSGLNKMLPGLTSFTSPYFINIENLNWGAKYAWIWAASNFITFGEISLSSSRTTDPRIRRTNGLQFSLLLLLPTRNERAVIRRARRTLPEPSISQRLSKISMRLVRARKGGCEQNDCRPSRGRREGAGCA